MKRTPLLRRTPMPRSTRRLPFRSVKRQAAMMQRRQLVAALLAAHPMCQVRWDAGCQGRAVDVDELLGRGVGGDFLDPANCQTTCRYCHRMKHANPIEAARRGVTVQRRRAA